MEHDNLVNINMVYKMMFVILARRKLLIIIIPALVFSGYALHRIYIHNENHSNNLLKS